MCNTVTYGLNSFRYKGVKIWNDLPNEIKNSITVSLQYVYKIAIEYSWSKTH